MTAAPEPADPDHPAADAGHPGAGARRRQAAMAGHLGDTTSARVLLGDPAPAVRATALAALARTGALTAADLRDAAGDPSRLVRARSAEVAAALPPGATSTTGMVSLVTTLLTDGSPTVVEAACFALGELAGANRPDIRTADTRAAVSALTGVAAGHDDPLCREAAVAALGAIGAPAGLAAVLAATTDKPAVRRRAVLALAPFEGPEVDAALERALSDRDWQVRQAAEDMTGRRT